jgi:hypothetical protein
MTPRTIGVDATEEVLLQPKVVERRDHRHGLRRLEHEFLDDA